MGIDEHLFSRRHGYATTFCDLKNHRVHDVVLGRSAASPEGYFQALEGKHLVRVVCIDLVTNYRALVHKHFLDALIVADRFHVIRLVPEWDGVGFKNRGLLSLMRRHRHKLRPEQLEKLRTYLAQYPALEVIYRFKQRLCYLLLKKHRTRQQCQVLSPRLLRAIYELQRVGLAQLVTLLSYAHADADGLLKGFASDLSEAVERRLRIPPAAGFLDENDILVGMEWPLGRGATEEFGAGMPDLKGVFEKRELRKGTGGLAAARAPAGGCQCSSKPNPRRASGHPIGSRG